MLALTTFPLAAYCLFLTFLNRRRRPTVFSGTVDLMFLAFGLSGLFLSGPGRLLIPLPVLTLWKAGAWPIWLGFYLSVSLLVALKLRRRIVIYNFSAAEFVPRLWKIVRSLDTSAAHLGNSIAMPNCGVQFSINTAPRTRNVVLLATGPTQSLRGWQQLETAIHRDFQTMTVSRGPSSWFFLVSTIVLFAIGFWSLSAQFPVVWEAVRESL